MNITEVIESLVEERGLDKEILSAIVCEGMLAAYKKRYPDLNFSITINKKNKDIAVYVEKQIVTNVTNENKEISLRKAKFIDPNLEVSMMINVPFDGSVGRIEILRAKQVIATMIRDIEAATVCKEFAGKQGTILQGIVHKIERSGVNIKIQDNVAFLPKSLGIPGENLIVGHPIRALLKDVLTQPKNENQLILDRASVDFVVQLFNLEIPEIYERLVEIRKVVRTPGYKTKVIVSSNNINIDPVGTCVGVGGVRIKPILKELGTEKIDIIAFNDSMEVLIRNALKPADINRVELSDDNHSAKVWLDDDQRSLAIGKMGQNITLASRLVGVNIELAQVVDKNNLDKTLEQ